MLQQPSLGRSGICDRLLCGKGLGRNDEQRCLIVDLFQYLRHVGAIDVRYEMRVQALAIGLQRFGDHEWTQIGATDANVDHIGDLFAGAASPYARDDLVGELLHMRQLSAYIGHHILAIKEHGFPTAITQGRMQNSTIFGYIDVLSTEHGIPCRLNASHLRQLQQQRPYFLIHSIL